MHDARNRDRSRSILNDADTGLLPNAAENGVTADRIRLTGNYATSDAYLANGFDSAGARVHLQQNWQAFRRSFGVPFSADAFTETFRMDRMLHIQTQQGNHFFVRITGANAANFSVDFTPALGVGGNCVVGLADGALVSPLSRVEYFVTDLTGGATGTNLRDVMAGGANRGDIPSHLVRREILFDAGGTPIVGTERVVLEYVADVNYSFVLDQQATVGAAPQLVVLDGAAAQAAVTANPHRIRSVTIRLSNRTSEQDPRFPWIARAAGAPLTRYRANNGLIGAARVRTITAEVVLPNVAYRMIRP